MAEHAMVPRQREYRAIYSEIIQTTRSMRRLKPDPVPNALIHKILEAAVCAPSGGNMQRWRFGVRRSSGERGRCARRRPAGYDSRSPSRDQGIQLPGR